MLVCWVITDIFTHFCDNTLFWQLLGCNISPWTILCFRYSKESLKVFHYLKKNVSPIRVIIALSSSGLLSNYTVILFRFIKFTVSPSVGIKYLPKPFPCYKLRVERLGCLKKSFSIFLPSQRKTPGYSQFSIVTKAFMEMFSVHKIFIQGLKHIQPSSVLFVIIIRDGCKKWGCCHQIS